MGEHSTDVQDTNCSDTETNTDSPHSDLLPVEVKDAVDFETAASLTGFGLYNYLILCTSLASSLSHQFSASSTSYLLPAAQCDLEMNMSDKGLLNSITFAGMVVASFFWGFFSDMLGRRKLLVIAYLLDGIINFIGSFTQSFAFLVTMKFLSGAVICGPNSIQKTFISEFHCVKYRTLIISLSGFLVAVANIITPVIAWLIIPNSWSVTFFGGYITYNSWRLFVAVGSFASFLAGFLIYLCPETPKFLMTKGRTEEAMEAFRIMYKCNTRKNPETYPVKKLLDESYNNTDLSASTDSRKNTCSQIRFGLNEAKRLLVKPLRNRTIMIVILQFATLLSVNTIRLWIPQMFASAEEYREHQKFMNNTDESVSMCEKISFTGISNSSSTENEEFCGVGMLKNTVYINNIIIASCQSVCFLLASTVIKKIGKKITMVVAYVGAAVCSVSTYWTYDSSSTLACFALFVSFCSLSRNTSLATIVDMFPTSIRTLAMSINTTFSRMGAFSGNLSFPYLLAIDCVAPFSLITTLLLICAGITMLLPNTDKTSLQ